MPKPQSPHPIITCTWMARVRPQLSFLQHRYHTSTRRSHKTRWTNIHFQPWKMPEMGRPADQMAIHTSPSSVQHLLSISASPASLHDPISSHLRHHHQPTVKPRQTPAHEKSILPCSPSSTYPSHSKSADRPSGHRHAHHYRNIHIVQCDVGGVSFPSCASVAHGARQTDGENVSIGR